MSISYVKFFGKYDITLHFLFTKLLLRLFFCWALLKIYFVGGLIKLNQDGLWKWNFFHCRHGVVIPNTIE